VTVVVMWVSINDYWGSSMVVMMIAVVMMLDDLRVCNDFLDWDRWWRCNYWRRWDGDNFLLVFFNDGCSCFEVRWTTNKVSCMFCLYYMIAYERGQGMYRAGECNEINGKAAYLAYSLRSA
jgi:hypothetical protein